MSTLVFVDPESSTQADGAQSSRVPVTLPKDPCEAIKKAYLDGTNTESEPLEDPIDTETLESPLAIAPPILLSESTPPVLIPILCRTTHIAVRVPHVMLSGLFASMEEVAAMSESALCKRFRPSYKSSPSVSPPDLPSWNRYRGTSKLVEDSKEDDDEEDEEIEESMDSDSVSDDAEDEGHTAEDKDLAAEDEGLTARVEGLGIHDEEYGLDDERHGRDDESRGIDDEGHSVESGGLGLEEEEAAPGGQQHAAPVVRTAAIAPLRLGSAPESERPKRVSASRQPTLTTSTDPEDGMIYIDIPDYPPPAPLVQTPPSPEWTSGLLPISPSHFDVPLPISSHMIPLTMQGGLIRDHAVRLEELSPALFERSLEYEQERVAVTFGPIWRPVLAFEAWAGQTDAQRTALWHVISDVQGENQVLRLQLAEERRARLELAEVVDGIRRRQEPRGAQFCPCVSALRLVARDRADTHFLIRMWRE
ncbi:hypothetical protein Tco_1374377, partial [Tanacetum coccineum]